MSAMLLKWTNPLQTINNYWTRLSKISLFVSGDGHVVGSRPMKKKEKIHRMIIIVFGAYMYSIWVQMVKLFISVNFIFPYLLVKMIDSCQIYPVLFL